MVITFWKRKHDYSSVEAVYITAESITVVEEGAYDYESILYIVGGSNVVVSHSPKVVLDKLAELLPEWNVLPEDKGVMPKPYTHTDD